MVGLYIDRVLSLSLHVKRNVFRVYRSKNEIIQFRNRTHNHRVVYFFSLLRRWNGSNRLELLIRLTQFLLYTSFTLYIYIYHCLYSRLTFSRFRNRYNFIFFSEYSFFVQSRIAECVSGDSRTATLVRHIPLRLIRLLLLAFIRVRLVDDV